MNINVGFFTRQFTERGCDNALYDYANYNELILNNKSYIICFTTETQKKINFPEGRIGYERFKNRFKIIEINIIDEMRDIIKTYNLDFFYTITDGIAEPNIYKFYDKTIWGTCKTIKHCVFNTHSNEADYNISVSQFLNSRYSTHLLVIPHIVTVSETNENLRKELNIPEDAIVIGRHGGYNSFDTQYVKDEIIRYINNSEKSKNTYFLFLGTEKFIDNPKVIHLDTSVDLIYKTKFINTCNAMIHASNGGETFGMAISEFSIKNKPVITCDCGNKEHTRILGDKCIIYRNSNDLKYIFDNINYFINSRSDWNAYSYYNAKNIMKIFHENIFSNLIYERIKTNNQKILELTEDNTILFKKLQI